MARRGHVRLWLVGAVVAVIVSAAFPFERDGAARGASVRRPAPQQHYPREYIEIEPIPRLKNVQGTAFSVSGGTRWMTARHVIERCNSGQLSGGSRDTSISEVLISETDDVAILKTEATAARHFLISARRPEPGDAAYLFGFAQGEAQVVPVKLLGAASARQGYSPYPVQTVLNWVEAAGAGDSRELSGMSGGPALNANGEAVGVFSASGIRRGRVVTANPWPLAQFDKLIPQSGASASRPIKDREDAAVYLGQMVRARSLRELVCES